LEQEIEVTARKLFWFVSRRMSESSTMALAASAMMNPNRPFGSVKIASVPP